MDRLVIPYLGPTGIGKSLSLCQVAGDSCDTSGIGRSSDGIDFDFEGTPVHSWSPLRRAWIGVDDPWALPVGSAMHLEFEKLAASDAIVFIRGDSVLGYEHDWGGDLTTLARDLKAFGRDLHRIPVVFQANRLWREPPGVLLARMQEEMKTDLCTWVDSVVLTGEGVKEAFRLAVSMALHQRRRM